MSDYVTRESLEKEFKHLVGKRVTDTTDYYLGVYTGEIQEDEWDYYYVVNDFGKILWVSAVAGLKAYDNETDY